MGPGCDGAAHAHWWHGCVTAAAPDGIATFIECVPGGFDLNGVTDDFGDKDSSAQIEVHLDRGVELVDHVVGCVDGDFAGAAVARLRQYTAADQGVHVEFGEEVAEGSGGKRAKPGAIAEARVGVIYKGGKGGHSDLSSRFVDDDSVSVRGTREGWRYAVRSPALDASRKGEPLAAVIASPRRWRTFSHEG